MRDKRHKLRWLLMSPLGLAMIGFGISLVGEAILLKGGGASFLQWFGLGTLALVIVNSGIAVFGDAVKHRVLFELDTQGD